MPDDRHEDEASLTELGIMIATLARSQIHTMMPGTVIAYHAPNGAGDDRAPALVDVRPDFLYRRRIDNPGDTEGPEKVIERTDGWHAQGEYPDLVSCPVAYAGHDGMRSSGPIKPGAHGWLIFAERSIDGWINKGGPIDPAFDFQWHHLSDAIFVPGARFGRVAEDIPNDVHHVGSADGSAGMEIATADGSIKVATEGPEAVLDASDAVKLGQGAVLGVARLTDPVSADTSMSAWIAQAQAVLAGAAALLALPVPVPPTDFGVISGASTKVSAE